MKRWSRKHVRCVLCSGTEFRHMAYGLCNSCYQKIYKSDSEIKARIDKQKQDWRDSNRDYVLMLAKERRERIHFDNMRDTVLDRDGHACTQCRSEDNLVVHHKDGNGRGSQSPNNELSNLTTLCKACHANEHRKELLQARAAMYEARSK